MNASDKGETEDSVVSRPCYRTSRKVEFSDTDVAGIVHFSRFYVFMETAEHEFLNSLGTSVHAVVDGRLLGWPRLMASCEFFRPARFEDTLRIELCIERLGTKSVTYSAEFSCDGQRIAKGSITSVCCVLRHGERPRSVAIPADLVRRMQVCRNSFDEEDSTRCGDAPISDKIS